jgi:hypothetical protein
MFEIKTNIKDKSIIIKLDDDYSFGLWFIHSIENWLAIGYNYWILKSKKTWRQVWFWRIVWEKKEVNVIKKWVIEEWIIEMEEKVKPSTDNWLKKYFNF